jgi:hypothetical protein
VRTRSRGLLTALVGALTLVASIVGFIGVSVTSAAADPSTEAAFVQRINSARASSGLPPLAVASDLVAIARQHSQDMASQQRLYHNPNLTTQVQNWQSVGENVGYGPSVDAIHNAFMNSTEHRDNILDPSYTQVGVGTVTDSNGVIWVTEDFRQPMGTTASAPAPTTHRSAPAPAPARTTSRPAATHSTPPAPVTPPPPPPPSPEQILAGRLAAAQASVNGTPGSDPVSRALDFVHAMAVIAG